MDDGDSDDEDGEGDVTREEDGEIDGVHSRSGSTESKEGRERSGSRKKPRITLARGEACVACR